MEERRDSSQVGREDGQHTVGHLEGLLASEYGRRRNTARHGRGSSLDEAQTSHEFMRDRTGVVDSQRRNRIL